MTEIADQSVPSHLATYHWRPEQVGDFSAFFQNREVANEEM